MCVLKLEPWTGCSGAASLGAKPAGFGLVLAELPVMELQGAVPGPLSPGALSPTLDYAAAASPGLGGPGPSHGGPGVSGPAGFNYNQLEGRFKQLQGKRRSFLQTPPPLPQPPPPLGPGQKVGGLEEMAKACLGGCG